LNYVKKFGLVRLGRVVYNTGVVNFGENEGFINTEENIPVCSPGHSGKTSHDVEDCMTSSEQVSDVR
jgi:hypothetical protein